VMTHPLSLTGLPSPPDFGFIGGDATLFDLDRAFDTDRIVVLHGLAGAGKTALAVEFAAWYVVTGGVAGPVLFTSLEQPKSLSGMQFPQQSAFLEGLLAQHKLDPTRHLHGVMELASLYEAASIEWALSVATEYNSYLHTFVRGVLEQRARPAVEGAELTTSRSQPVTVVHPDLSRYQRVLEVAR
jgi:hypothetical protein